MVFVFSTLREQTEWFYICFPLIAFFSSMLYVVYVFHPRENRTGQDQPHVQLRNRLPRQMVSAFIVLVSRMGFDPVPADLVLLLGSVQFFPEISVGEGPGLAGGAAFPPQSFPVAHPFRNAFL